MKIRKIFNIISLTVIASGIFLSLPLVVRAEKKNVEKEGNTFSTPDFAFPETVEKNALMVLKNPCSPEQRMQAAIQVTLARNIVSDDNMMRDVELLDSLASVSETPYKELYYLLEAKLYDSYFRRGRRQYSSRNLPADTIPANPAEWAEAQFVVKVRELVQKSLSTPETTQAIPIEKIKGIIDSGFKSYKYFPSVYDFISVVSCDILSTFSSESAVIPFFPGTPGSGDISVGMLIKNIRETEMNRFHEKRDMAPWSYWAVESAPATSEKERFEWLMTQFRQNQATEYGGNLLAAIRGGSLCIEDKRRLYDALYSATDRFPEAACAPQLRNSIRRITQGSIKVNYKGQYLSGCKIEGEAVVNNVDSAWLLLLRVPENISESDLSSYSKEGHAKLKKLLKSLEVRGAECLVTDDRYPFSEIRPFSFPAQPYGRYIVVGSKSPGADGVIFSASENIGYNPMTVSDLRVIQTYNPTKEGTGKMFIVSGFNQKPVKGAEVKVYERTRKGNKRLVSTHITDEGGNFPVPDRNYELWISNGKDHFKYESQMYFYQKSEPDSLAADIFTDLSIYHPGDTVRFTTVVFDPSAKTVAIGRKLKCSLYDVNMKEVASQTIESDSDGRCEGSFRIPEEGVLGNYSIRITYGNNWVSGTSVTVAEYKAPSFFVDIECGDSEYTAGDIVKITGESRTYSGMPVADAVVSFNVRAFSGWWWRGSAPVNGFYGGETKTDSEGRFVIELPTAALKGTAYERCLYSLVVTVTSSAGESQESGIVNFSLGKAYTICSDVPDKIEASRIDFKVSVKDILAREVEKTVRYEIVSAEGDSTVVASGEFMSPSVVLDWTKIYSGKYKITFSLPDYPESNLSQVFILYRNDDKKPPYFTPLWIPDTRYVYQPGEKKVDVKVGSMLRPGWILYETIDAAGNVAAHWMEVSAENKKISIPVSGDAVNVTFFGTSDLDTKEVSVNIIPQAATERMKVEVISFRDKITPGAQETWEFKFSYAGKGSSRIPVLAVMSDKALDALTPFVWNFYPERLFRRMPTLYTLYSNSYSRHHSFIWNRLNNENVKEIAYAPGLDLYGYNSFFPGYGGVKFSRAAANRLYGASAMTVSVSEDVVYESVEQMAMPDLALKKESAVDSEAEEESGAVDGNVNGQLRQMSCPIAFFRPNMNADNEGNLSLKFTVPDYNTTWKLQLLGYDYSLHHAYLSLDALAAKEVMVKSNVPRFLRTGDKTSIGITLYNNSEEERKIGGKVEFFDPLSGNMLYSQQWEAETVAPGGSRVVFPKFTTPSDQQLVGFRAYALTDGFSDGEQTLVSILPSSSPVFESTPFYIGQTENEFSVRLPEYPEDAIVSLQYCDNPVWTCVTSLPDIIDSSSDNVISKINAFYGNEIASGLVSRYPRIENALKEWFASPGNQILVSPLEKNNGLKTFILDNTIWINDGRSESLRMQRLESLLDSSKIRRTSEKLIKDIAALQNLDGGWGWCPGMDSSDFITEMVLCRLGMLRWMGFLDSGLKVNSMIEKAVKYCDAGYVKLYKKFKILPTSFSGWLYIRSFFDVATAPEFASLKAKGLREIAAGWRSKGIYQAASDAIVLHRSGKKKDAVLILESLGQKAVKSPVYGMYYDNLSSGYLGWSRLITTAQVLEAYSEILPSADEIDKLRQWLLIQKQMENWGEIRDASEVVYAILSSGTDWTENSAPAEISIGGEVLNPVSRESGTGEFVISLSPEKASGALLTVKKNGTHPSWGAVLSQSVIPIADIKAVGVPDLTVTKEIYAVEETGSGTSLMKEGFSLGRKVRVVIRLESKRDLEYVAVTDSRAACLEPVEQLPSYSAEDGVFAYREPRNSATNFFISFLPKGTHILTYDCYVSQSGEFASGIVSAQSQYAPSVVAHSAGEVIIVKDK